MNRTQTFIARKLPKPIKALRIVSALGVAVVFFLFFLVDKQKLFFLEIGLIFLGVVIISSILLNLARIWEADLPERRKETAIQKARSIMKYENSSAHLQTLVDETRSGTRDPKDLEDWLDKYEKLRNLERTLSEVPQWRIQATKLQKELGIERK